MLYYHSAPEKEQIKEKHKIIMTFIFKPVIKTA